MRLQYGDKVWIKDQSGIEQPWVIEKENDHNYEVYHGFVVSHISKEGLFTESEEVEIEDLSGFNDRDSNGSRHKIKRYVPVKRIKYRGWLYMPEHPNEEGKFEIS